MKKINTTISFNNKLSYDIKRKSIWLNPLSPNFGRFAWIHFIEDPVFGSHLFQKFITHFVKDGKKLKVQKVFYRLFSDNGSENKLQLSYFYQLIEKLRPSLVVVPSRRGRNILRVPMPISVAKSYRKAMRFFVQAINDRKTEKTFEEKIYSEFYDLLFTPGYVNKYAELNFKISVDNSHLKHYRRFGVI